MKKTTVKSIYGKNRSKSVIKVSDTSHYANTRNTATVYKSSKKPIKVSKTKIKINNKGSVAKVKVKSYSPVGFYDKQKKTITRKTINLKK